VCIGNREGDLERLLECLRTPPRRLHARALGASVAAACDAINGLSQADASASGKNERPFAAGPHPAIPGVLWVESERGCETCELETKEVIISRKTGESALLGGDIHRPGVIAVTPGVRVGDRVSVLVDLDDRFLAFAPVKLLSTLRCSPAWLKGKWAALLANARPRDTAPPCTRLTKLCTHGLRFSLVLCPHIERFIASEKAH